MTTGSASHPPPILHRIFLIAGICGLAFSLQQLFGGHDWIKPYFFLFAWFSYLLAADGVNGLRRGSSLITRAPFEFGLMLLVSVPWWLLFELVNFRLKNWEYSGLPQQIWIRWPGYGLAFSTVLPAVCETAGLIEPLCPDRCRALPMLRSPRFLSACVTGGIACLVLPLIWPALFFPLVWGFVFLIGEPELIRNSPDDSWLFALSEGRARRFFALLGSGAACGVLWEFFNYWSGAKWKYTVPWPPGPKLFEMPWAGYLGFPPFALECASFWAVFKIRWNRWPKLTRRIVMALLVLASLGTLYLIDRLTLVR